jgi:antitoxin (DNA-binding transcriptional repressor) of toxin-antitoxin stability system
MKTEIISVTEAARNFAECVNRVRYQRVTFVLVKNGVRVARLEPIVEKATTGRELAKALRKLALSRENAKAGGDNLRRAKKTVKSR